jgi:hypothetical protein
LLAVAAVSLGRLLAAQRSADTGVRAGFDGIYTFETTSGGTLDFYGFAPAPFPSGVTLVEHVSAASPPACVHDVVVPFPGGFDAPAFCIAALGFSVKMTQTGCGIGKIDSNGGSDFTVTEIGDTSSAPICANTQACMNGIDSNARIDVTVGDGTADTCGAGGLGNAMVAMPVRIALWQHPGGCPDPDGMPGGPGDQLAGELEPVLDLTTDSNSADWLDVDGDGCCLAGFGPGSCGTSSPGLSGTGVCINFAANTVTTVASGPVGSSGGLFDATVGVALPSTFTGPSGPPTATCASPPTIDFSGLATRCN